MGAYDVNYGSTLILMLNETFLLVIMPGLSGSSHVYSILYSVMFPFLSQTSTGVQSRVMEEELTESTLNDPGIPGAVNCKIMLIVK